MSIRSCFRAAVSAGDLRHSSREASQDGASPEQWAVASQKWAELYRWVPPGGLPHVPPTIGWEEEGFWPELPEDEQRYRCAGLHSSYSEHCIQQ